jgi:hypothetical protein
MARTTMQHFIRERLDGKAAAAGELAHSDLAEAA